MSPGWRVDSYVDANGGRPVNSFIAEELEPPEQGRLKARLAVLQERGLGAGGGLLDKVQGGKRNDPRRKLWELRLPNSPNNPRFLLFATGNKTLVLLHGFKKIGRSNDKIPESDIQIALNRMHDHLERQTSL